MKTEQITKSEYCIKCQYSYQDSVNRFICRNTKKIVVGRDGRATVNAMKCR